MLVSRTACLHALMVIGYSYRYQGKVLKVRPGTIRMDTVLKKTIYIYTYVKIHVFAPVYVIHLLIHVLKRKERRRSQTTNSASVAMAKGSRSRAPVHAVAAQPLRPMEPRVLNGSLAKLGWLKLVCPWAIHAKNASYHLIMHLWFSKYLYTYVTPPKNRWR